MLCKESNRKKLSILLIVSFLFLSSSHRETNYREWKEMRSIAYDSWSKKQNWSQKHFIWVEEKKESFNNFIKKVKQKHPHLTSDHRHHFSKNPSTKGNNHTINTKTLSVLSELNIWSVIVGISHYNVPAIRLNYCDDDAYKLYAFLKSPEGGALPENRIKLLIDEDATKTNIKNTLESIIPKLSEKDVFIFYFSGHGTSNSLLVEDYKNCLLYTSDAADD